MVRVNAVTIESCRGGFVIYGSDGERYVIGHDGSLKGEAEALSSSLTMLVSLLGYGGRFMGDSSDIKINISVKDNR